VIRTKDPGVAQELYFRIQAGEQSFAEVAREYSQGPEAYTCGLLGPVELSMPTQRWRRFSRLVNQVKYG